MGLKKKNLENNYLYDNCHTMIKRDPILICEFTMLESSWWCKPGHLQKVKFVALNAEEIGTESFWPRIKCKFGMIINGFLLLVGENGCLEFKKLKKKKKKKRFLIFVDLHDFALTRRENSHYFSSSKQWRAYWKKMLSDIPKILEIFQSANTEHSFFSATAT